MITGASRLATLLVVLAAACPGAPVAACGLEGGLGDSFGAAHPGSLEVAFAVRDAIDGGVLAQDAALAPALAHERADERLRTLAAALPAAELAAPVAVLLIESGTWTRLTQSTGVWAVTGHADGPRPSDATMIASELALRDLASGRLSADQALERGVLVVTTPGCCRESLVGALRQAYPGMTPSVVLR